MTEADGTAQRHEEPPEPARPLHGLIGAAVRTVAPLWVIGLLLTAAAFGGVAVNMLLQTRAELAELRKAPGPDSYAVVAYRREMERQLQLYARSARVDAVPAPLPRPRLLEEIDLARQPDPVPVRRPSVSAPISAPP